jgi:hypothetical protein
MSLSRSAFRKVRFSVHTRGSQHRPICRLRGPRLGKWRRGEGAKPPRQFWQIPWRGLCAPQSDAIPDPSQHGATKLTENFASQSKRALRRAKLSRLRCLLRQADPNSHRRGFHDLTPAAEKSDRSSSKTRIEENLKKRGVAVVQKR